MEEAILLLGGNLGDRKHNLEQARKQIAEKAGDIIKTSSLYESEPWGFEDNNPFLNQAIKIKTSLSPEELINILLEIEQSLGRTRTGTVSARVIDIDILFYGDKELNTPTLTIPHPRISARLFALLPLSEITEDTTLPVLNSTCKYLLINCPDKSTMPQKIN